MPPRPEPIRADLAAKLEALERAVVADPSAPQACPSCTAAGLEVDDQSTRPFMLWYVLRCAACGFSHRICVPLAGHPSM